MTLKLAAVNPLASPVMVVDCGPATGDGIPGASVAANQFVEVAGFPTKENVRALNPIQSVMAVGALLTRKY